jgi:hypothetical protein
MNEEQIREAFEAKWIEGCGDQKGLSRYPDGEYRHMVALSAWIGFKWGNAWTLETHPPISPEQREVIDAAVEFIEKSRVFDCYDGNDPDTNETLCSIMNDAYTALCDAALKAKGEG